MSVRLRGRKVGYDNIASGSAYGGSGGSLGERTVAGETVSMVEMYGGGYRTSTSTGDVWHSNVQAGSSVTDQTADGTVAGGPVIENIIAQGTTMTDEKLG